MKTMSLSRGPSARLLVLMLTLAGSAMAGPAAAQDVPSSEQEDPAVCRCVDRQGNEIEDCTCFRMPRMEALPGLAFLTDRRARLGISVDIRGDDDSDGRGARVVDVLEGGPAAEAGLREGDIITHVDGRSLSEPIGADAEQDFDLDGSIPAQRLLALGRELEPGETVEVAYIRDGTQQTTMLEAEDLSERLRSSFGVRAPRFDAGELRGRLEGLAEGPMAWRFHHDGPEGDVRVFGPGGDLRVLAGPDGGWTARRGGLGAGLGLAELNPDLGEYFGSERGVLVTEVGRESTTGLEPGDVVLAVDGREVTSPRQLRRILASYDQDEDAEMRVLRHGDEITLTAPMRRP